MTSFHFLLILAVIGLAETTYLILKRVREERPICPIGNDCHTVLTSKYNRLFGIHNDILGLGFYLLILALSVIGAFGDSAMIGMSEKEFRSLVLLVLLGGSIFSFSLVMIQWRWVKAWCFWCLSSSVNIWLMTLLVFLL